jgi:hypothetical protein
MSSPLNISTAATTIVFPGACRLEALIINGGVMGAVTLYDNASVASGKVIATIAAPLAGMVFAYMCDLVYGLVIVTAAATVCIPAVNLPNVTPGVAA